MSDFPVGKFKTILADPPWPESGGGKVKRGADKHYGLMKVRDIAYLPVHALIHPDGCHLYLWVTNNFLHDGLHVLDEWGLPLCDLYHVGEGGAHGSRAVFPGNDRTLSVRRVEAEGSALPNGRRQARARHDAPGARSDSATGGALPQAVAASRSRGNSQSRSAH